MSTTQTSHEMSTLPSDNPASSSLAISPLREPEAIAPSTSNDDTTPAADGASVLITLLLTNGKRHPYVINERYLRKRNVDLENNDPWELPVEMLKELILRDWRDDWEDPPNSASKIRLIMMGVELEEGQKLKDKRFNRTGTNIVHMVVKRDIPDDEELKTGTKPGAHGESEGRRSACCGCTIL